MLSPTSSQELLLSKSASNITPVYVHCSYNLTQQNLERSRLDFTTKKYDSTKPPETRAKIDVSCVNCDYFKDKIDWRGHIVGKGFHGSVYAFFTRIKHKHKLLKGSKRLLGLLTICNDCCVKLGFDGKPDKAHVLKSGVFSQISATLILSVSYKDIQEVVSSRVIIMEGPLMSAIRTIGINGGEREWDLLNRPKPILENW